MNDETWFRVSRDPAYVLQNIAAIARGERPVDTRSAKPPKEYISRHSPIFREVMLTRTDDVARGQIVIL